MEIWRFEKRIALSKKKKNTFSPKCRHQLTPFFLQVFDVVLNGDLTIASDLDVFERVGRGVAHDEYIDFEVKDGKILYEGDESEISAGKIRVEFIKSYRDNPKVNAIIVGKGSLSGMYNIQHTYIVYGTLHNRHRLRLIFPIFDTRRQNQTYIQYELHKKGKPLESNHIFKFGEMFVFLTRCSFEFLACPVSPKSLQDMIFFGTKLENEAIGNF